MSDVSHPAVQAPYPLDAMPPYPWQQAEWERFTTWTGQQRLAHALLLAGPEGLGGFALAQAMAAYLLCQAPLEAVACGKCRSCQLVKSEGHPDLQMVTPDLPAKAIKVDQVRQVGEFISKTAQQGGRKIVVISPAEAMNGNAANALLKSLEEPTPQTYLLLVSPEPSRLLATIRSRCAKVPLTVPPPAEALTWLENLGVRGATDLLQRAGGQPLKVKRWYEEDFVAQQARMERDLAELCQGQRSALSIAKSWLDQDALEVVDAMLYWVQQALRGQMGETVEGDASRTLAGVPAHLLCRFWDKIARSKGELMGQNNVNVELLLDDLLMGWASLASRRY